MIYVNASAMNLQLTTSNYVYTFAPGTYAPAIADLIQFVTSGKLTEMPDSQMAGRSIASNYTLYENPVDYSAQLDRMEGKIDATKVVVDNSKIVVDATKVVVDSTETKVDAMQIVVDRIDAEVTEVEKHLHNDEYWWGVHPTYVSGVTCGSRDSSVGYVFTSGNGTLDPTGWVYGAWLCLLGTSDTPVHAGYAKFDPHRLNVVDVQERQVEHKFQFATGADTAAADAAALAGLTSEVIITPENNKEGDRIIDIIKRRVLTAVPFWGRLAVKNVTARTCSAHMGTHEYLV